MSELTASAGAWAEVALSNIEREFPHAELLYLSGPSDLPSLPRGRHPAFFGSYDWHSCVEMHWVLVRLVRLVPDLLPRGRVIEGLGRHLSAGPLRTEAANLPRWERPYGYAWTLMLADEIHRSESAVAESGPWAEAMRPLVAAVVEDIHVWLSRARYPVRTGLHGNSAFSLSLSLRYARRHDAALAEAIASASMRWFAEDADYPASYEPSGSDFLSPALVEAELMSQLLDREEFTSWLSRFLPSLGRGSPPQLFTPVEVSDPSDGQIAHLHGLNLSRAWCFRRLSNALPEDDMRRPVLERAADEHRNASLDEAVGSDYMVEHWLAAYALLLATADDPRSAP